MKIVSWVNSALGLLNDELIARRGIALTVAVDEAHAVRELADAQALVTSNSLVAGDFGRAVLQSKTLRFIQSTSAGCDQILALKLAPHVRVLGAPGITSSTVALHAISLLLAMARSHKLANAFQREKIWDTAKVAKSMISLEGETALCVGFGAVGKKVADLARAFGMNVISFNRSGDASSSGTVVSLAKLEEHLPRARAIILALPGGEETTGRIGKGQLEIIRPGALLVNVGRGEVLDEQALLKAVREGQLGGAALDVTSTEPLPHDHPFWSEPNILISPHVGGQGVNTTSRLSELIAANLNAFASGNSAKITSN